MDFHYRVKFSRDGDMRFLSHLDILRAFERALRRTGMPLAFTVGFNPRVRTSFAQALSVGLESAEEWMLLTLTEGVDSEEILQRLGRQLSPGLAIVAVETQASRKLAPVSQSEWFMRLSRPCQVIDLKAAGGDADFIEHLAVEGCTLTMRARHSGGRSIHPRTALKLLGYTEEEILSAQIRRLRTILGESASHKPEQLAS
ncbi:MAG: TIGR03936 family radical SAM-associated protein [Planctomycetota bacterium]